MGVVDMVNKGLELTFNVTLIVRGVPVVVAVNTAVYVPSPASVVAPFVNPKPTDFTVTLNGKKLVANDYVEDVLDHSNEVEKVGDIAFRYAIGTPWKAVKPDEARGLRTRDLSGRGVRIPELHRLLHRLRLRAGRQLHRLLPLPVGPHGEQLPARVSVCRGRTLCDAGAGWSRDARQRCAAPVRAAPAGAKSVDSRSALAVAYG